jgi:hypothetical protein
MDTNSTTISALRVSRRAAKTIALVSIVACLAVTGFAAAVTGAGAALSTQQDDIVSVDRTHKGDRLPLAQTYLNCVVARRDNTIAAANRV